MKNTHSRSDTGSGIAAELIAAGSLVFKDKNSQVWRCLPGDDPHGIAMYSAAADELITYAISTDYDDLIAQAQPVTKTPLGETVSYLAHQSELLRIIMEGSTSEIKQNEVLRRQLRNLARYAESLFDELTREDLKRESGTRQQSSHLT